MALVFLALGVSIRLDLSRSCSNLGFSYGLAGFPDVPRGYGLKASGEPKGLGSSQQTWVKQVQGLGSRIRINHWWFRLRAEPHEEQ